MRAGGVLLGQKYLETEEDPDLILASSMMDLSSFLAVLAKGKRKVPPLALYCHENQFLYPVPSQRSVHQEQRDHFGAANWRSTLLADRTYYNSEFHRQGALRAYEDFIRRAPDHREEASFKDLEKSSKVFPPAPDLKELDQTDGAKVPSKGGRKLMLWNHRWESEKGTEAFAEMIHTLLAEGWDFDLALAGQGGKDEKFRQGLAEAYPERTHLAHAPEDRADYIRWLKAADLSLVCSHQDFFGLSVVEAMYCRTVPILPDRLAYPEHLSSNLKGLLYKDREEALERTRSILDQDTTPIAEEARQAVAPYDVREWIEAFDQDLEKVAGRSFA